MFSQNSWHLGALTLGPIPLSLLGTPWPSTHLHLNFYVCQCQQLQKLNTTSLHWTFKTLSSPGLRQSRHGIPPTGNHPQLPLTFPLAAACCQATGETALSSTPASICQTLGLPCVQVPTVYSPPNASTYTPRWLILAPASSLCPPVCPHPAFKGFLLLCWSC